MIFKLSKEQYKLLKSLDLSELGSDISYLDTNSEISVDDGKVRLLRILITEEIDRNGLTDDQNDVTPYGRKLYDLHDTIYSQT